MIAPAHPCASRNFYFPDLAIAPFSKLNQEKRDRLLPRISLLTTHLKDLFSRQGNIRKQPRVNSVLPAKDFAW